MALPPRVPNIDTPTFEAINSYYGARPITLENVTQTPGLVNQVLGAIGQGKNLGIKELTGAGRTDYLNQILGGQVSPTVLDTTQPGQQSTNFEPTVEQTALEQLTTPSSWLDENKRALGMALLAYSKPVQQQSMGVQQAPISIEQPSEFSQRMSNAAQAFATQAQIDKEARDLAKIYSDMYGIDIPTNTTARTVSLVGKAKENQLRLEQMKTYQLGQLQTAQDNLELRKQMAEQNYNIAKMNAKTAQEKMQIDSDWKEFQKGIDLQKLNIDNAMLNLKERETKAKETEARAKQDRGRILPPKAVEDITGNKAQVSQIDTALEEINKYPEATGLAKGVTPLDVLNRIDPKGVQARAALANLTSMVIKDRSGAAVTASEFPRLKPFLPMPTDDAKTIRYKLGKFKEIINEENNIRLKTFKSAGYDTSGLETTQGGSAYNDLLKKYGVNK